MSLDPYQYYKVSKQQSKQIYRAQPQDNKCPLVKRVRLMRNLQMTLKQLARSESKICVATDLMLL